MPEPGFGDSCTVPILAPLIEELPTQLVRYHGCGLGRLFDETTALAVLVARLRSLAAGYSGVRLDVLTQLEALIRQRIAPLIPEEGSVGVSGDLTPLSYVAAALTGERRVKHGGLEMEAIQALEACGIAPLALLPKEGLALMNGTAVMTALGCLAGNGPNTSCGLPPVLPRWSVWPSRAIADTSRRSCSP